MDKEDVSKEIKKIEEETLAKLSKLRAKKDAIVSNYIAKLREKKIEDLRKDIQSSI
ncbi:hypothetical protein GW765_01570 [Candidatus Parcubacteria bacterium]|nr:hypothetical protein [Candidatus Parcubacteria bacterium]